MLDAIQSNAFNYFLREPRRANGLVADKTRADWPASIAAVGLALTTYPVGVERGYLARDEAAERTLTTLRFFWRSKQGPEPDATGHKGFYYHFLDMQTGARAWRCELSTVDSALLLGGMLTAAEYFDGDAPAEREIRDLAERLYARVDWRWAQNGGATVTHGWRPEQRFPAVSVARVRRGAAALRARSRVADVTRFPRRATGRGRPRMRGGPSSTSNFCLRGRCSPTSSPTFGLTFAASKTPSCASAESTTSRTVGAPRWCSSSTASAIPAATPATAKHCWGITASDGPGDVTRQIDGVERRFFDYLARAVPDGPDDGTIAPWAVVASLPFAPEIVLPTIAHFLRLHLGGPPPLRFQGDVQPNLSLLRTVPRSAWVSPWHFGLNQGPMVVMIENYRSGIGMAI